MLSCTHGWQLLLVAFVFAAAPAPASGGPRTELPDQASAAAREARSAAASNGRASSPPRSRASLPCRNDGDGATSWVCNGAPGERGAHWLVAVSSEAGGESCPYGGIAVRKGLDRSRDGVLQPAEVTSTSRVCDGAPGEMVSLARQDDEPAGPNCAFGGKLVSSGLDADRDGVLGAEEVTASEYLCNGPLDPPEDDTVVEIEPGPPAPGCPAGTIEVSTALDANGNGVIDEGDLQSTVITCRAPELLTAYSDAQYGGVCPRGGVRVEMGLDLDANGVLDPGEADPARTRYACNRYVVQLAAGWTHTCALVSDGSAACWGGNSNGQLGDGTTLERHTPVVVSGLEGAAAIAAGRSHTCALLSDGSARCWGRNDFGQLGDGTDTDRVSPVVVAGLTGAASITAGGSHSCVLMEGEGSARCWGANGSGQLGDGTAAGGLIPVAVSGLSGAAALDAGESHTCAVLGDGTAACWGANFGAQLGLGSLGVRSLVPVPVSKVTGAASIAAGEAAYRTHTCALLRDGSVTCWGEDGSGQCGVPGGLVFTSTVVPGIAGGTQLVAGNLHTCALVSDGTARCWGANLGGALGDGTQTGRSTPLPVAGLSGATSIVAGGYHTCAITTGASVLCWGSNWAGQLGDGTREDRFTPVSVAPFVAQ